MPFVCVMIGSEWFFFSSVICRGTRRIRKNTIAPKKKTLGESLGIWATIDDDNI